ncbi:MAG: hypothetical protein ACXAEF_11200 [Candidatus Thorarchaeota archaeon]
MRYDRGTVTLLSSLDTALILGEVFKEVVTPLPTLTAAARSFGSSVEENRSCV